jgi:hypothetical protein
MTESTHHKPSDVLARTKRALMYIRVASAHKADQVAAIDAQRAACEALAARCDLRIIGGYVDLSADESDSSLGHNRVLTSTKLAIAARYVRDHERSRRS